MLENLILNLPGSNRKTIHNILKDLRLVTKTWNIDLNKNIHRRIETSKKNLAKGEETCLRSKEIDIAKMELEELQLIKDNMLRLQVRVRWL